MTATGLPLATGATLLPVPQAALPEHLGGATDVAFSADGRLIATVGRDARLAISDAETGAIRHELLLEPGPPDSVGSPRLAFAPHGTLLAVGYRREIRFFDAATGEGKGRVAKDDLPQTRFVAFTSDGKRLVSLNDQKIHVWSPASGELERTFEIPYSPCYDLAVMPGGSTVAHAGPGKAVSFLNVSTGEVVNNIGMPQDTVTHLAVNADGTLLAVATIDSRLAVYDLRTLETVATLEKQRIDSLAFSSDGLLAAGAFFVSFFRIIDKQLIEVGTCGAEGPSATGEPAFSPDGRRFAFADSRELSPAYYRFDRSAETRTIASLTDGLNTMAVSPDGRWAAWTDRKLLTLYSTTESKTIKTVELPSEQSDGDKLEFSPDGRVLAYRFPNDKRYRLQLYDVPTLKTGPAWRPENDDFPDFCFLPGGSEILIVYLSTPRFWDYARDKVVQRDLPIRGTRVSLLHSSSPKLAVGNHWEDGISIFKLPDGEMLREFPGPSFLDGLAVSPDGALVATYSSLQNRVFLRDANSGASAGEITADPKTVTAMAFSSDGRWLLTGGSDLRLKVWSRPDWNLVASLPAHLEPVGAIRFLSTSSRFFTTEGKRASHTLVKEWDLSAILEKPTRSDR